MTTTDIKIDYETRAALGLNDKTAFSCMPARARELLADSKRFQWIITNGVQRLDDLYDACNWAPRPGQIEALIDAEIAEAGR